MELYIYYQVTDSVAPEAMAGVLEIQRALRQRWPGLQVRLLQREQAHQVTFMETYAHPEGLSAAQLHDIEAVLADQPRGRLGPRHAEHFLPCSAPQD